MAQQPALGGVPLLTEQGMRDAVFLSTQGLGQRLYCYSSNKVQSSNLTETVTMYRRALAAKTQLLCELSVPPGTTDPHLFPQHTKDNSDRSRRHRSWSRSTSSSSFDSSTDSDRTRRRTRSPDRTRAIMDIFEDMEKGGVVYKHRLKKRIWVKLGDGAYSPSFWRNGPLVTDGNVVFRRGSSAPRPVESSTHEIIKRIFDAESEDGKMLVGNLGDETKKVLGSAFRKKETIPNYLNDPKCPLVKLPNQGLDGSAIWIGLKAKK